MTPAANINTPASAEREWIVRFADFMAYLLTRGWRRAFILRSATLHAPGMMWRPIRYMSAANDR